MPQLVTFHLDQLRCIVESDAKGGSEPYLWVTYFFVDGRNIGQPEPVITHTPFYDAFRREFPDNVRDGQVIQVPIFIAKHSAEIDSGPLNFMMAGCVVALLEEDETPDKAIRAGRNAFMTTLHEKLNDLIRERIQSLDRGPVTEEETKAIQKAIESKVESAIKANESWWEKLTLNQDDMLGFSYVAFIGGEIQTKNFEFPELGKKDSNNRFVLSGSLTVGPLKPPPVDPCATLRSAVQAKSKELKGLQTQKLVLQQQLQTAPPQAKPGIIAQINAISAEIGNVEQELRLRESLLRTCETGLDPGLTVTEATTNG